MISARIWLTARRRHFDGYHRPPRAGLIVALLLLLAGSGWIDVYEVPFALRSLACDIQAAAWSEILTTPRLVFGSLLLFMEALVWVWIVVWIWPVAAVAKPVPADWLLVGIVFLLGASLLVFQIAALQPGPWHQCLNDIRGI